MGIYWDNGKEKKKLLFRVYGCELLSILSLLRDS